jgi:hypothetical protein
MAGGRGCATIPNKLKLTKTVFKHDIIEHFTQFTLLLKSATVLG